MADPNPASFHELQHRNDTTHTTQKSQDHSKSVTFGQDKHERHTYHGNEGYVNGLQYRLERESRAYEHPSTNYHYPYRSPQCNVHGRANAHTRQDSRQTPQNMSFDSCYSYSHDRTVDRSVVRNRSIDRSIGKYSQHKSHERHHGQTYDVSHTPYQSVSKACICNETCAGDCDTHPVESSHVGPDMNTNSYCNQCKKSHPFGQHVPHHDTLRGISSYFVKNIDSGSKVIGTSLYANSVVHLNFDEQDVRLASLIDAGANCNCIQLDTLRMVKPNFKLKKYTGAVLNASNKQSITSLGTTYVEFTINGHPSCAKVHVFENLNQRFILGRPWIISNQVQLDFAHETVRMKTVPLFASETYTLKAGEVSLLQARFSLKDSLLFPDGLDGRVSPRHAGELGPQVIDTAATCCNGRVPVMIRNKAGSPILIRKASAISNFCPLSFDDLNENAEWEDQNFHYVDWNDAQSSQNTSSNAINSESHILISDIPKRRCTSEQSSKLRQLLQKHQRVFSADTRCSKLKLVINLKPGRRQICHQPYQLPPDRKEAVNKQIEMLLAQDKIDQAEKVHICSPLLAVNKHVKRSKQPNVTNNPKINILVDVRHLNSWAIFPHFEITSFTSILHILADAKPSIYSTMNFNHRNKEKTCQWNRMFKGISPATVVFTQRLKAIFRPYIGKFMVFHLEILLIFSKNFEDHLKHLDLVLSKLEDHDLTLSPDNCSLATKSARIVGFEISKTGLQPSNDVIGAIRTMQRPLHASTLRCCLKLFALFHTFIPNRGKLISPLLQLLNKGVPWQWSVQCEQSFEALKETMSTKQLLHHADSSKQYHCVTDWSISAIACVILQVCDKTGRFVPIAFASRTTTVPEQKRPVMELQALAVVFCITTFSHYLTGKDFILYSDNGAVNHLFTSEKLSRKLRQWALFLCEYSFSIEYVKTSDNKVSECLTKCPCDYTPTDAEVETDTSPHVSGKDMLTIVNDACHPMYSNMYMSNYESDEESTSGSD